MAIPVLTTTRYVPPEVFIGQIIRPQPAAPLPNVRIPAYICRGNRLVLLSNMPIRRSFVYDEELVFTPSPPYTAELNYQADGNQLDPVVLNKSDGTVLQADKWMFTTDLASNDNGAVIINPEMFDPNTTYYLSYQSIDRTVLDPIATSGIREIRAVGDQQDQSQYNEFIDYVNPIDASVILASVDASIGAVSVLTADAGNIGTGVLAFNAASSYLHAYNRAYTLSVGSVTGAAAVNIVTVNWTSTPLSGGNSGEPPIPLSTNGVQPSFIVYTTNAASQTQLLEHGLLVDFSNVSNGFSTNDQFTFNGLGPALIEYDSRLFNTNQYLSSEFIAHTGTGDTNGIDLDESNYSGTYNVNYAFKVASTVLGTYAYGRIVCVPTASIITGQSVRISDGSTSETFVFDTTGGGITNGVTVDLSAITTTDDVALALAAGITGSHLIHLDVTVAAGVISLTNDRRLASGNVAIVETVVDAGFLVNGMSNGNGTQTVVNWSQYGSEIGPSRYFTVDDDDVASFTQILSLGVQADVIVSANDLRIDDEFRLAVKAPRIYCVNKDDRDYKLTINSASNPTTNEGYIQGTYQTNTPEGRWGTFTARSNLVPNGTTNGHFSLPDNVQMVARNMIRPNRLAVNDEFEFTLTNALVLDWSLTKKTTETFQTTQMYQDLNGRVTGIVGSWYVILNNIPETGTIEVLQGVTVLSFAEVADSVFIYFLTKPTATITVSYEYRGIEPDPGALYYLTATFLRIASLYNSIQLIQSRGAGRELTYPISLDNHAYIINEVAWDNNPFAIIIIQVQDIDDDGIYTKSDYETALRVTEADPRITDKTVLSRFDVLPTQLSINVKANDPFEKRESLDWFGMPIGTTVGSITEPSTLVYTAKRTLQVYGESPAHGTRILVSPTWCKKTLTLEDKSQQQVTLDGSFVAGGLSALVASFTDPATTILRKFLAGFDDIQVYENQENLVLGGNDIVYFTDQGGTFRIEEDITVDQFAPDFHLISGMTQKQATTKDVRKQLDDLVISIVPPSTSAGVAIIKSALIKILLNRLSRGLIAPYQDDQGNERPFDPNKDVVVFANESDKTLYHFTYAYWIKKPIKRAFGLYSVDSNDFGLAAGGRS